MEGEETTNVHMTHSYKPVAAKVIVNTSKTLSTSTKQFVFRLCYRFYIYVQQSYL